MALDVSSLNLVCFPHPVLRQRAERVAKVTDEVRAVAARMIEIMRQQQGIGLAAPQVGLPWRMFVCDVPEDAETGRLASLDPPTATKGPRVYINPEISEPDGPREPFEEGCLSLPHIRGDVVRPVQVRLTASDETGRLVSGVARGLLARCWQHEMDHLDGVLIIDRMTQMARMKNRAAIRELESQRA